MKLDWNSIKKFSADSIWYVGVVTAIVASVMAHNPTSALMILALHVCKEWLDLRHRVDHNIRIRAIELRLNAGGL